MLINEITFPANDLRTTVHRTSTPDGDGGGVSKIAKTSYVPTTHYVVVRGTVA